QPKSSLSVSSSIYIWNNNTISQLHLADGAQSSSFTFPSSGTIDDVAYNDQIKGISYITTTGDTDTLKFRYKDSDTFWTIDHLTRTGPGDVEQAAHYQTINFSGNDILVGDLGFWEGCSTRVYSIATKKKLFDNWCGSFGSSPGSKH